MSGERSGKELIWSFLLDAWDALAGLEEGVKGLGTASSAQAIKRLGIISHRLKGSAALFGFPQIAAVARAIEVGLEAHEAGTIDPPASVSGLIRDAHAVLQDVLNGIALGNAEDPARFADLRRKHDLFFSLRPSGPPEAAREVPSDSALIPFPEAASAPSAGPAEPEAAPLPFLIAPAELPAPAETGAGVFDDLQRFFLGNPDASFFVPEAGEHLETVTGALFDTRRRQEDPASTVATLFRGFHTLKGAAYTVGCAPLGALSHRVEDLLTAVRSGQLPLEGPAEKLLFLAVDALRLMLPGKGTRDEVESAYASVLAGVEEILGGGAPIPEMPLAPPVETLARAAPLPGPEAEIPKAPGTPFGATIRVRLERLEVLLNLATELTMLRGRLEGDLESLEDAESQMAFSLKRLDHAIREFEGKYASPQLEAIAGAGMAARAAGGGLATRSIEAPVRGMTTADFSEVEFERYDDFNLLARAISELNEDFAQAQGQVKTLTDRIRGEIETLGGSLKNLRGSVGRARLVEIGQLFGRFRRLVRQQEQELGKSVVIDIRGESAELDNFVLEQISDPLLHLVQNAITHGIETSERRAEIGKDPVGRITLSAYSRGNRIWIEVADDGAGIDPMALREQAISLGLVSEEAARRLDDREAMGLMYLPGFSTVARTTKGAGRGVGMDVVRTNILRLKGEVDVESRPGHGTRFTLKVPLTLVVIQALLVEVDTQPFAVPMSSIETLVPVPLSAVPPKDGEETLSHGGEVLPVVRLRSVLGLDATPTPAEGVALLLRGAGRRFFAFADRPLRSEDVVVKSLGAFLERLPHLQGAALTGLGELIPVLEPGGLLELGRPLSASGTQVEPSTPFTPTVAPGAQPQEREREVRILVVDDSISVRKVVRRMLAAAGFAVETAADGEEALDRLRLEDFSLVITDLEMPRINGYELIQQIRGRPAWTKLPILVLTTRVGERHVKLAQELGATGFLSKPVDEEKLISLVRRLSSIPRQAQPH